MVNMTNLAFIGHNLVHLCFQCAQPPQLKHNNQKLTLKDPRGLIIDSGGNRTGLCTEIIGDVEGLLRGGGDFILGNTDAVVSQNAHSVMFVYGQQPLLLLTVRRGADL